MTQHYCYIVEANYTALIISKAAEYSPQLQDPNHQLLVISPRTNITQNACFIQHGKKFYYISNSQYNSNTPLKINELLQVGYLGTANSCLIAKPLNITDTYNYCVSPDDFYDIAASQALQQIMAATELISLTIALILSINNIIFLLIALAALIGYYTIKTHPTVPLQLNAQALVTTSAPEDKAASL